MSTETSRIVVGGIPVDIVRKEIKNLHLGVYPPNGRVRVAAPLKFGDEAVRLAVVGKLGWIKRQQASFKAQSRQSTREMAGGESHYFLGRRYRLRIVIHEGPPQITVPNKSTIELRISARAGRDKREQVLQRWYRQQMRELIPPILDKWQAAIGVQIESWGIKRMKTKWGTCNASALRIWLNLELVKKSVQCVEYIVVHELVHLIERKHNDRFIALMNMYLPQWRIIREELNRAPLAHDSWNY